MASVLWHMPRSDDPNSPVGIFVDQGDHGKDHPEEEGEEVDDEEHAQLLSATINGSKVGKGHQTRLSRPLSPAPRHIQGQVAASIGMPIASSMRCRLESLTSATITLVMRE